MQGESLPTAGKLMKSGVNTSSCLVQAGEQGMQVLGPSVPKYPCFSLGLREKHFAETYLILLQNNAHLPITG